MKNTRIWNKLFTAILVSLSLILVLYGIMSIAWGLDAGRTPLWPALYYTQLIWVVIGIAGIILIGIVVKMFFVPASALSETKETGASIASVLFNSLAIVSLIPYVVAIILIHQQSTEIVLIDTLLVCSCAALPTALIFSYKFYNDAIKHIEVK